MDLGALITKYREAKGMNITKLARVAGLSRSYLSQIESGAKGPPSAKILLRIAEELNMPMTEIIGISQGEELPSSYLKELQGQNEINKIVKHVYYSTKDSANYNSIQQLENFQINRQEDKLPDKSSIQKFKYNPVLIENILLDLLEMEEQGQRFIKKQIEVYKELFAETKEEQI